MTCWRICRHFANAALVLPVLWAPADAQDVTGDLLRQPARDSWPTYHGDYSGRHHSPLTQITPANVSQLGLAWAFQTNAAQSIKATPILVNGVIYVSAPDNVWAIDARSGRQFWRYTYPANDGFKIGHRGVAVLGTISSMSRRRTRISSHSTRAPARCGGTSRSPTPGAATGRPTRRSSSATT